jgi:hypothetical protein
MVHPARPGPLDSLSRDDVTRSPGQPMTASGHVIAVLRVGREQPPMTPNSMVDTRLHPSNVTRLRNISQTAK